MKNTPISTIMTSNVVCLSPEQKIVEAKHIYEKSKFHHHIPVIENDSLVGMVSLVDFMYHIKDASLDDNDLVYHQLMVKDIMSSHPLSLSSTASVEEVARELAKGQFHAIPIIDEGKVVGIVSTKDVIDFFLDKY